MSEPSELSEPSERSEQSEQNAAERGILTGLRVVDLSSGISGPVAAMLLAEAGADVVHVEPPGGDPMRASPGFRTWNRSKRGLALDLHDAHDRLALDTLLAAADVLVHGLRPRVAARHGLDDAALRARFPQLVSCSVLGYPVGHPDADRPGHDILVQARMGLMDEQRGHREGPIFLRWPLPSWGAAYLAAIGILARLRARTRDGRGGAVHTSLLQGALAPMMQYWARAERPSPAFAYGLPKNMLSGLYECGDGRWIHMMGRPDAVRALPLVAEAIGAVTPAELERARADIASFAGTPNQTHDPAELVAAFRRHDADTWLELFWASDIPVQPAAAPGDVLRDPQARANGYLVEVDEPGVGRVVEAGTPYAVSPPARVRHPAPPAPDAAGADDRAALLRDWAADTRAPKPAHAKPTARSQSARGPLAGLRVVDFGNYLAGPFAAMLMADLGADVIKVEAATGDAMRPVARSFCGCQRGKRSVALDLKRAEVRPFLEALVRDADVVHHNLRYPAARKLRIDDDSLRALNPELVYCHTSSYGPRGPRADWPGYDQLFQACSGWEVAGGGRGNPPIWHRMGMMDHQNALASLVATLLALTERDRTGVGQFVTASILGAAVMTMSELYAGPEEGALPDFPELDAAQTGIAPGYRIYRARGGWLAVAALGEDVFGRLLRVAKVDAAEALEDALAGRDLEPLVAELDAAGVPAEAVRLAQESGFFERPEHRTGGVVARYPHAEMGELEQVGAFWNLVDLPIALDRAPPALGEHTREVLRGLGASDAEIDALAASGAIAVHGP